MAIDKKPYFSRFKVRIISKSFLYEIGGHMNTSRILSLCALIVLIMLPGCKKQKPLHRTQPLKVLNQHLNYEGTHNGVSLRIRKLGRKECIKLFGRAGRRLVSKTRRPLMPLHLSIANNSDESYVLKQKNIDLDIINCNSAAGRLRPSVPLKTVGAIAGGAVLTTLVAATGAGLLLLGATLASAPVIMSGIATCASSAAIFLIATPVASAVKGVRAVNECRLINQDMQEKTLVNNATIKAGTKADTLVFVPLRKMKSEFSITLESNNPEKNDVIFDVIID